MNNRSRIILCFCMVVFFNNQANASLFGYSSENECYNDKVAEYIDSKGRKAPDAKYAARVYCDAKFHQKSLGFFGYPNERECYLHKVAEYIDSKGKKAPDAKYAARVYCDAKY